MGKEKYQKRIEELFKKSRVVSYASLKKLVNGKRNSEYAKQLIRNLILKGVIKNLTKGFYSAEENPELLVFCLQPAYLGLQNALSFYNLWEQETIPVVITSRRVRQGIRKVVGMNVLVRRIEKKYFFGINYAEDSNIYLPYSDIEKTAIDLIYFNEHLSKEVANKIKKRMDKQKLQAYLRHYPERMRKRVLKVFKP